MKLRKMTKASVEEKVAEFREAKYGFEIEKAEDGIEDSPEIPFDADKIRVEQKLLSLKYVKEMLDDDKLFLSPGFQRNVVWTEKKRKSLLIESLMLRIPIPAFYFYEDEDSKKYVIDGLQRLSTINDFLEGEFKLSGLQYLNESCGNKYFKNLESKYITRIYDTQLAINIIDARTPAQVKYDIFRRINTGGIPLNAQEVRNSIAKPHIRQFLKELGMLPEFRKATREKIKELRMDTQEMALRFIAFYQAYDFSTQQIEYRRGDLESFLDDAFENLNGMSNNQLKEIGSAFSRAMVNAYALFGRNSFTRPNSPARLVNKPLYTCWSVLLSQELLDTEMLTERRELATNLLSERIISDRAFDSSLSMGTSAKQKIHMQFAIAREILEEVLS